jgi:hypothetical protein
MAQAKIRLVPMELSMSYYISRDTVRLARQMLADGLYTDGPTVEVAASGEAAAEEVFDLTNNSSRQEECELKYGRGRSVSVGDIVEVDGTAYVCAPVGWAEFEAEEAVESTGPAA